MLFSEIIRHSTAVAFLNADDSNDLVATRAELSFGNQIAVDMPINILKKFWPDLNRRLSRKHNKDLEIINLFLFDERSRHDGVFMTAF